MLLLQLRLRYRCGPAVAVLVISPDLAAVLCVVQLVFVEQRPFVAVVLSQMSGHIEADNQDTMSSHEILHPGPGLSAS